ncbi:glycoside hydrolase family 16 protein [Streptomyces sp. NPDC051173]|uniref:glycoside hydrolase family 16 protein n=1 Tax=Streptomyces sp. NPDC051173 TaxID=3155164 RepID=UPI00344BAA7C
MRRLATIVVAAASLLAGSVTPAYPAAPGWHLRFADDFDTAVPPGSFTGCNHHPDTPRAYCTGLSGAMRATWWAYPKGWPDTATQRGYPVGGFYDPATTLSVSGGQLHIRLWRGPTSGVHSATVVPKALMGQRYGRYEERWRVSKAAVGYKSAHLLWPVNNDGCSEIDFPELEWDTTVAAFAHPSTCAQQVHVDTGARWTSWHTTVIEWRPGDLRFYLDGTQAAHTTKGVPAIPMTWDIQNESALNGENAAPNSSAQMDIDYVRGWTWN